MAEEILKANTVHAHPALGKHLFNRAHGLLCPQPAPHSESPQATTCHGQHLASGSDAVSPRLTGSRRVESSRDTHGHGLSRVFSIHNYLKPRDTPPSRRDRESHSATGIGLTLCGPFTSALWHQIQTVLTLSNPGRGLATNPSFPLPHPHGQDWSQPLGLGQALRSAHRRLMLALFPVPESPYLHPPLPTAQEGQPRPQTWSAIGVSAHYSSSRATSPAAEPVPSAESMQA